MEELTRRNRYEGRYTLATRLENLTTGDTTAICVEFTKCRSCGTLVAAADQDLHERLHPRISCGAAHPLDGNYHPHGHPWEAQFT